MKQYNITLIITENCNLKCSYCYVNHENKSCMDKKTINDTFIFIEKMLIEEQDSQINIDIFGGEPLLEWNIVKDILIKIKEINELYDHKIHSMIFTNGTLLNDEILNFCKDLRFCKFSISLDGCKDCHDECRVYNDNSGSFDDTFESIKLYSKIYNKKNHDLGKTMISPSNTKYMMDNVKFAIKNNINRVSMGIVRDDIWNDDDIKTFEQKLYELKDFYIKNIDSGLWLDIFSLTIIDGRHKKDRYCGAGRNMFAITPSGDIYPCQRFYNNRSPYKLGHVSTGINKDNVWYKVFNNYNLDFFHGCNKCKDFDQNCVGQCMASCYESNNNIFMPINSACKLWSIIKQVSLEVYEALKDNPNYQKTLNPNYYGG
jgi:uncharacterized protein